MKYNYKKFICLEIGGCQQAAKRAALAVSDNKHHHRDSSTHKSVYTEELKLKINYHLTLQVNS